MGKTRIGICFSLFFLFGCASGSNFFGISHIKDDFMSIKDPIKMKEKICSFRDVYELANNVWEPRRFERYKKGESKGAYIGYDLSTTNTVKEYLNETLTLSNYNVFRAYCDCKSGEIIQENLQNKIAFICKKKDGATESVLALDYQIRNNHSGKYPFEVHQIFYRGTDQIIAQKTEQIKLFTTQEQDKNAEQMNKKMNQIKVQPEVVESAKQEIGNYMSWDETSPIEECYPGVYCTSTLVHFEFRGKIIDVDGQQGQYVVQVISAKPLRAVGINLNDPRVTLGRNAATYALHVNGSIKTVPIIKQLR